MPYVKQRFLLLLRDVQRFLGELRVRLAVGHAHAFPKPRDFAYACAVGDDVLIVVAPHFHKQSPDRIEAVLRHEFGHVLQIARGHGFTEREADLLAERVWGDRIYYDDEDVQTLVPGVAPRPRHLHQ